MPTKSKPKAAAKAKADPAEHFDAYVKDMTGEQGLLVVQSIGDGATDEKIEKSTKFKLSEIRAILNSLQYNGIVEYTREKNMTTGWFTYTWKVNMNRAMQNFMTHKKRECEALRSRLGREGDRTVIYKCPKGCSNLFFNEAERSDFACPSCATKLKFSDGSKQVKEMESKLAAIESMLASSNNLQPGSTLQTNRS